MLVIFDCDGVLVDSEWLGAEVFSEVLAEIGFMMSPQACFDTFKGLTLKACKAWVEKSMGRPLPVSFHQQLDRSTEKRFSEALSPINGIANVLSLLVDNNVAICVASNGGVSKIKNSLQATKLLPFFPENKRFSAEHVATGKPAPDIFLHAAVVHGVKPELCWVVEDSLPGCQAAVAAGMNLIVYDAHHSTVINETVDNARSTQSQLIICHTMQAVQSVLNTHVINR